MSQFTCASLISSSAQLRFLSQPPHNSARTFESPSKEPLPQKLQRRRDFKDRKESLRASPQKLTSRPQEPLHRSLSGETISSSTRTFLRQPAPSNKYYSSVTSVSSGAVTLPRLRQQQHGQLAPADLAFLLLGFISCMTAGALIALVTAAIPTLNAMRRAALSLDRLAITAHKELPGALASITLSGLELSDATMGLTDLSQEISEGLRSSARVVKVAEDGIRRIGVSAASKTLTMLQACLRS